jgi:pimeloyl-ACP methyl ester carboxylesterase
MSGFRTRKVMANGLSFTIDEAGEGDTVALLLHGFPESRVAWRGLMPRIAGLGWRVVAPDMRGYGDSDRPAGKEAYQLQHLTADVDGLFDALGAKRRILIGHDWGGIVAWHAALAGVRLDGLVVLNAPHPAVFARVLGETWRQRARSWYVAFFQLPGLPEWQMRRGQGRGLANMLRSQSAMIPEEAITTYARNILKRGAATAMINYYRANTNTMAAGGQPMLDVPTLMVWGDADPFLDIALTEGNEAHVRDFTLRRLTGVNHWVEHEAPDRVMESLVDWAGARGLLAKA